MFIHKKIYQHGLAIDIMSMGLAAKAIQPFSGNYGSYAHAQNATSGNNIVGEN